VNVAARPFNVLSLAAGAGGLELAVKLALGTPRLVCAVEIEAYAAAILAARMDEGALDDAPIWSDARTFDGRPWRGRVHCLTAGYPCQPFSSAGKRKGTDDPRHLWPHVLRIIEEVEPDVVLLENVEGHLSLGFDVVWRELHQSGRAVEAGLFTARETGAHQIRKRLFILACRQHPFSPSDAVVDMVDAARVGWGEGRAEPSVRSGRRSSGGAGSSAFGAADLVDSGSVRRASGADQTHARRSQHNNRRGELGDTERAELQRRGMPGELEISAEASEGQRHQRQRHGADNRNASDALVDAIGGGYRRLAEIAVGRAFGRIAAERSSRSSLDVPTFAPGPSDADAWRAVVARDAALVPAVRGMADELAGRVDRIRLGGNGVHPLEGAYALRVLAARLAARGNAVAADLTNRIDSHVGAFIAAAGEAQARAEAETRGASR